MSVLLTALSQGADWLLHNWPRWVTLACFAAFFLMERISQRFPMPSAVSGRGLRRWLRTTLYSVFNHGLLSSLLTLPLLVWVSSIHLWSWPAWVPGWALLILTVLVLDLVGYWFHRASHQFDLLWRFHQIHHLDESLDVTTGLRGEHIGQELMQAAFRSLFIIALSLPRWGVVVHAVLASVGATFHHTNVRIPAWLERFLGRWLITPAFHYTHHHALKCDTNSNYGFLFPFWDRLFGTYNTRRRTSDWQMGLEYSPDLNCVQLFFEPFRPSPLWERNQTAAPRTGESENSPLHNQANGAA